MPTHPAANPPIDRALRERLANLRRLAEVDETAQFGAERGDHAASIRGPRSDYAAERQRLGHGDLPAQVRTLSSRTPVALLPLRIETRFAREGAETHLLVRVYPDTIAIDSHERALTVRERELGVAYWKDTSGAGGEAAFKRVFATLPALRAAYVARSLRPTRAGSGELVFPDTPVRPHAWSRAPVSRVLPERLACFLRARTSPDSEPAFRLAHVGKLIPDPLPVGLAPVTDELSRTETGELKVPPSVRWLVDFDAAEAIGMGMRIVLAPHEKLGVDALIVVGVRVGSDADEGSRLLSRVLTAQRYTVGLDIAEQGTPTNVLADDGAGPAPRMDDPGRVYARELGKTAAGTAGDAARVASALGIDHAVLDGCVPGAEAERATAMNRALWPATLGYYFDQMLHGAVPKDAIEDLRGYFTEHVTGRGPLPCVRVGELPYGVVVTMPPSSDAWADSAIERIRKRIDRTRVDFAAYARGLSPLARGAVTPERVVEALSILPRSVEVSRRYLVGHGYMTERAAFLTSVAAGKAWEEEQRREAIKTLRQLGFEDDAAPHIAVLTHAAFAEETGLAMVVAGAVSETDSLPPLLADGRNYIEWLATASLAEVQAHPPGVPAPKTLLYRLLRHARIRGSLDAAAATLHAAGKAVPDAFHDRDRRSHVASAGPLDALRAQIDVGGRVRELGAAIDTEARAGRREGPEAAQLAGMAALAKTPTAELERLLAEHIDCCSHRLDAWVLGLSSRRLRDVRASDRIVERATDSASHGAYVGAYGMVHDLVPASRPTVAEGGFVQAPSLTHATAAAVLRSAHVGAGTDAGGAFATNLGSARVRRALELVDGVGNGQSLGALLGYRLERALHDAPGGPFDAAIYPLRRLAPLLSSSRPDDDAAVAVPAHDVVDGLRLLALVEGKDYPYGNAELAELAKLEGQADAVQAAIAAIAADLDACGDLTLAEAVFQTVRGNQARASAVLRAASEGHPFPRPEVVEAPRAARAVVHRLGIVLPTPSTAASSSPRARLAPAVDAWLGALIGDLGQIACHVEAAGEAKRVTLASLELAPVDCVALARRQPGWDDELRARIARAAGPVPAGADAWTIDFTRTGPGAPVTSIDDAWTLVDALDALTQRLRAARASDVGAPPTCDDDGAGTRAVLNAMRAELATALGSLGSPDPTDGLAIASLYLLRGAARASSLSGDTRARQVEPIRRDLAGRLAAYDAEVGRASPDLLAAARALLGPGATIAPPLTGATALDGILATATRTVGPAAIGVERFLEGVGRVRPAVMSHRDANALATLLGATPPDPVHLQVASPRTLWDGSRSDGSSVSLLLEVHAASLTNAAIVVIDEWTDLIPARDATTGVAFHANRPDAHAPQAVLLAVPRLRAEHWELEDLRGAVWEAFELARIRALTPYDLAKTPYAHLLPAVVAPAVIMGVGAPRTATLSFADELGTGGKRVRHA